MKNKRAQIILFGWGHISKKKKSEKPIKICEHCHLNYLYLTRVTRWFTLFFIPIIPYKSNHYLLCPNCEFGYEIDEENVEGLIQQLESGSDQKSNKKYVIWNCEYCQKEFTSKKEAEKHERRCKQNRRESWFRNLKEDLSNLFSA